MGDTAAQVAARGRARSGSAGRDSAALRATGMDLKLLLGSGAEMTVWLAWIAHLRSSWSVTSPMGTVMWTKGGVTVSVTC